MLQFTIITNLNRLRIGLIFLSFNSLTLHIKHNKLSLKITKNDVFLQKKVCFLVLFSFSQHNKPHFANSEIATRGVNGV